MLQGPAFKKINITVRMIKHGKILEQCVGRKNDAGNRSECLSQRRAATLDRANQLTQVFGRGTAAETLHAYLGQGTSI